MARARNPGMIAGRRGTKGYLEMVPWKNVRRIGNANLFNRYKKKKRFKDFFFPEKGHKFRAEGRDWGTVVPRRTKNSSGIGRSTRL